MQFPKRVLALTLSGCIGVGSTAHAPSPSSSAGSGTVMWTVAGASAGVATGLWVGLTKFDEAINTDRKVWTSATSELRLALSAGI
jgi:hypothetical protein